MAWTKSDTVELAGGGSADRVIGFTAASAGAVMYASITTWSAVTDVPGWTQLFAADDVSAQYVYTRTATGGETSLTVTQAAAGHPIQVTVLQFAPGTVVNGSTSKADAIPSGVSQVPLTGLSSEPKTLLALFSFVSDTIVTVPSISWGGAEVTHVWLGEAGSDGSHPSIYHLIGYIDGSTATSWDPIVSLGDTISPYTSARVALAIIPGAPAELPKLATPVVTVTGGSAATTDTSNNGTIVVTWPGVSNADHYRAEIAAGADATTGFTVVSDTATSPFTFTGLDGDNPPKSYTVAITAMPAE